MSRSAQTDKNESLGLQSTHRCLSGLRDVFLIFHE